MSTRTLVARGCALLLLAGCSPPPEDPVAATRNFLRAVIKGQLSEAYQTTAFGFKALETEHAFGTTAQDLGLVGSAIESVDVVSVSGRAAKLKAVLNTARGMQPFTVTLERQGKTWRVYSLKSPPDPKTGLSENRFAPFGRSLAFSETVTQPPPDDRTVGRLVREAMNEFAQAVAQRSFQTFYANVSKAWQAQLTERQLSKAFQGFIDQDVNLTGVTDRSPVLDAPPMVSTEGLLIVSGHYPTTPYEVIFVFKFVYEDADWKLFGLDINLRQVKPATPPPARAK